MKKTVGKSRNKKSSPKKNKTSKNGGAAGFTFGVNITNEGVLLNTNYKKENINFNNKLRGMTITDDKNMHFFYANIRGFVSDKVLIPIKVINLLINNKVVCTSNAPIEAMSVSTNSIFSSKAYISQPIIFTFKKSNVGITSILDSNNIEIDVLWPVNGKLRSQWGKQNWGKTNVVNKYDKEFWFNFKPFLDINEFVNRYSNENTMRDIINLIRSKGVKVPLINFYPINLNLNIDTSKNLDNSLIKHSVIRDLNLIDFKTHDLNKYSNPHAQYNQGRVEDDRNLQMLESKKYAYMKDLESLNSQIEKGKRDLRDIDSRTRESRESVNSSEVRELTRKKNTILDELEELKRDIESENRRLRTIETEKRELENKIRTLKNEKNNEEGELRKIDSKKRNLSEEIKDLQQKKSETESDISSLTMELPYNRRREEDRETAKSRSTSSSTPKSNMARYLYNRDLQKRSTRNRSR